MISSQNHILPIILAAVASMIVNMLWYSDYLFGKAWKKAGGKCNADKDLPIKLSLQFLLSLLTTIALYIMISIFIKTNTESFAKTGLLRIFSLFLKDSIANNATATAIKAACFAWLGFVVKPIITEAIWENSHWHKAAICLSANLVSYIVMALVIVTVS